MTDAAIHSILSVSSCPKINSFEKQHHGRGVVEPAAFIGAFDEPLGGTRRLGGLLQDFLDLRQRDEAGDAIRGEQVTVVRQDRVGEMVALEWRRLADAAGEGIAIFHQHGHGLAAGRAFPQFVLDGVVAGQLLDGLGAQPQGAGITDMARPSPLRTWRE